MNRMGPAIAERIAKGDLPTAFDPWDRADREICPAITTRMYDHTQRGSVVIFAEEEDEESL